MRPNPSVLAICSEFSDFSSIAANLAGNGIRAGHARDIDEAVASRKLISYDAILCETDRLSWRAALDSLIEAAPAAAVILMARHADEHLWVDMLQAGAFDVVEKPYRPEDLRWVVTAAVGRNVNLQRMTA